MTDLRQRAERIAKKPLHPTELMYLIEHALAEVRREAIEECAKLKLDPLMLPGDPDMANIYLVAWSDYQFALCRALLPAEKEPVK